MSSARPSVPSPGPLARLLSDARLRIAETDPTALTPGVGLLPNEALAIAKAVLSRRQQFTAGRVLARRALGELGYPESELASDADRVPRWPAGSIGSITHTHGWCAVAVAHASEVAAIGVDVEAATALEPALWERICRPEERSVLQTRSPEQAGLLAKAIFSAKESAYKALYPRVRQFLEFQGMRITFAEGSLGGTQPLHAEWHAELCVEWGGLPQGLLLGSGRLSIDPEWIVTGFIQ